MKWFIVLGIVAGVPMAYYAHEAYQRVLYQANYDASLNAPDVETPTGNIPIIERNVKWTRILSGDRLQLSDGKVIKLQGVTAPVEGEPFFEDSKRMLEGRLSSIASLAYGPLTPLPNEDNTFEAQLFTFRRGWAGCGNTPRHQRVPRWSPLNVELVVVGACRPAAGSPIYGAFQAETQAMQSRSGMWKDPSSIMKNANMASLRGAFLGSRGYESYQYAQILLRAEDPQALALFEKKYEQRGRTDLSLVSLMVKLGESRHLDDWVVSLVQPNSQYTDKSRSARFKMLKEDLQLPFQSSRQLYLWYCTNRDLIEADKDGMSLTVKSANPRSLGALPDSTLRLIDFRDGIQFPLEELWELNKWGTNWKIEGDRLLVMYEREILEIDTRNAEYKSVFKNPGLEEGSKTTDHDFAVLDGVIVIAHNGIIRGVLRNNGTVLWEHPLLLRKYRRLGSGSGRVYLELQSGEVIALNPPDGRILWKTKFDDPITREQPIFAEIPYIAPIEANDQIVLPRAKQLLFFDPQTGALIREFTCACQKITSEPVVYKASIYFVDNNDLIRAVHWGDGRELWTSKIRRACYPGNNHVEAINEGVAVNEHRGIKLLSHTDGSTLRDLRFHTTKDKPIFTITDDFVFSVVSEGKPGSDDECTLLTPFRRDDWSKVSEWRLHDDAWHVSRRLCAEGDRIYIGKEIHCIRANK